MADSVVAALTRLRASGRHVIVVTGRQLEDLGSVCGGLDRFDYVVAENGALVYESRTREITLLAEPPPKQFVLALRSRGVHPLAVGRAILATQRPHQTKVEQAIREFGLKLQIILNKGAVMVLPVGVNKATGMMQVLGRLGISADEVVGVGDAENDDAFLRLSGYPVAVANALDSIKSIAAFVTAGEAGEGVRELIDVLLARDSETVNAERIDSAYPKSG